MGMALYKSLASSPSMDYRLQGNMTLDTTLPQLKNVKDPINQKGSNQCTLTDSWGYQVKKGFNGV